MSSSSRPRLARDWTQPPVPALSEIRTTSITDHNGDEVRMAWHPRSLRRRGPIDHMPAFAFQVYLTMKATKTAQDPDFPSSLFCEVGGDFPTGQIRFDVYTKPLPNIFACIEHQKQEVEWRNRNGVWPRLVSQWNTYGTEGYCVCLLLIEDDDWATKGVSLVSFDQSAYLRPRKYAAWSLAGVGDIDVVSAEKFADPNAIYETLQSWWSHAGGESTAVDLDRRNQGGYSPALYPAMDPASHDDVNGDDDDDNDDDDGDEDGGDPSLPGPAISYYINGVTHDGRHRIRQMHHVDDLWVVGEELRQRIRTATYTDTSGHITISIWDGKYSKPRPEFSVTLYCGDKARFPAAALFSCLNTGLIAGVAWTLDVKFASNRYNNLGAAYANNAIEAERRTTARTDRRRECIQKLLEKICGHALPTELREYIVDLLVPPQIPDYFSWPNRPWHNVCLYLNPDATEQQSHGPLIVYSLPHQPTTSQPRARTSSPQITLRAANLRFWHRVADEIHTLYSFCGPRRILHLPSPLPKLLLHINLPETMTPRSLRRLPLTAKVRLLLEFDQPITIHIDYPFFFSYLWEPACQIFDVATNTACSTPEDERQRATTMSERQFFCQDSWSLASELGLAPPTPAQLEGRQPWYRLLTLEPGISKSRGLKAADDKWYDGMIKDVFQDGREYKLVLKKGAIKLRWAVGKIGEVKGPFDLPLLEAEMEPVRFRYVDDRLERAP